MGLAFINRDLFILPFMGQGDPARQVMDMGLDEQREHVRGKLSFRVKFRLITREEYGRLKRPEREVLSQLQGGPLLEMNDALNDAAKTGDTSLIHFLVKIDEKLDRILAIVSKDHGIEEHFGEGTGIDVSGSGMKIFVDEPVQSGQIIHLNFLLAPPLGVIDVFGEVVHVVSMKGGKADQYCLGIKFLNLRANDQERIISSVFQKQRETLRQIKEVG